MLALSLLLRAWPFLALLIHLIRLLQPGPNSPVVCYFWYWLAEFRITEKFIQSCYLMESWRMLLNFENRSPHSLLLLKVCGSCRLWAFFSFRASHWFLFRRRLASWWLQWPHPTCPTSQEITLPSTFKNFSGAGMLEFIQILLYKVVPLYRHQLVYQPSLVINHWNWYGALYGYRVSLVNAQEACKRTWTPLIALIWYHTSRPRHVAQIYWYILIYRSCGLCSGEELVRQPLPWLTTLNPAPVCCKCGNAHSHHLLKG